MGREGRRALKTLVRLRAEGSTASTRSGGPRPGARATPRSSSVCSAAWMTQPDQGPHLQPRRREAIRDRLDGHPPRDGAGTPPRMTSCCNARAPWYVEQLDAAITAEFRRRPEASLRGTLRAAITRVQSEHAAICPDPDSGRGPSSTVALARRDGERIDVLVLGDSPIVLDHGTHVTAFTDARLADVGRPLREEIKTALGAGSGYDDPAHNARRRQLVDAERASRNHPGGYWIAADEPDAASHALTASYSIGGSALKGHWSLRWCVPRPVGRGTRPRASAPAAR